jgi:F-type H+-transporting ATPase subunit b
MHVSAWNVALQAINFLVLAWLLQRFLFKPVRAVLVARQESVAASIQEAAAKKVEAERTVEEYRAKSRGIAGEAERARQLAIAGAEKEAIRIHEEAARLLRTERERAKDDVERERADALRALEAQARDLAISIAERLLHDVMLESDAPFLWQATGTIDALDAPRKTAFARQIAGGTLEIVSAHPLETATRERFEHWLVALVGGPVRTSYGVDTSLIAGVELRLPTGVWRSHWRASIERMRAELGGHEAAA